MSVGFLLGSTDEAGAPTLTDRWDKPYMGPPKGGTPSPAEMEAYIRMAAMARGMDPDIAVRVAKSEGLYAYKYSNSGQSFVPGEQSFGPFQLNYARNGRSLGDAFSRRTGLNARDPGTWRQQVDFSLDEARSGGWGPWHGWKGAPFAGIGARGADLGGTPGRAGGGGSNTVTIGQVNFNGSNITDAATAAKELAPALDRAITAGQADNGLN